MMHADEVLDFGEAQLLCTRTNCPDVLDYTCTECFWYGIPIGRAVARGRDEKCLYSPETIPGMAWKRKICILK